MTVRIEKSGSVWTIINSRPAARNAINPDSAEALYNAFVEFEQDENASVAVFWGEGGAFCAGWDLKNAATLSSAAPFDARNMPKDGGEHDNGTDVPPAFLGPTRLELDKPVIAAVAGPAVAGGMELALWCDFRVMEASAYFGVYCRRWGVPLIDGG
ncbi:MAG: enoyl-CoA hydratase-related protein, partial [Candidatus Promineifilaceae bacterium]